MPLWCVLFVLRGDMAQNLPERPLQTGVVPLDRLLFNSPGCSFLAIPSLRSLHPHKNIVKRFPLAKREIKIIFLKNYHFLLNF